MITGFTSVILFKFVVSNMESIGAYFKELDVLAPSFALAMLVGYIVSKIFPPKHKPKTLSEPAEKVAAAPTQPTDQGPLAR